MRCILRDEPLSLDPHPYTPHPLSLPAAAALFSAVVARLARAEGGAVALLPRAKGGAVARLARREGGAVALLARVEGGAVAWLAWREDDALRRLAWAEVVAVAHPPPGYSGAASS